MKIAIAQLNPTIGNLPSNAQEILENAQKAADEGASVLLTPELSLCGYPPRDLLLNPGFINAIEEQLTQLAQQLPSQLHVLVGTVQRNPQAHQGGKPLYNSIACLTGGQVTQHFHKRLLPTYDVFDEHRYFEPHSQSHHFTVSDNNRSYRIGVTICEDIWNDEEFWSQRHYACNPLADLADSQVDLIVNLSASPYTVEKQKLRESMLSHAARRYQVPILYVNQVGGNDDLIFDGRSVAFNGDGSLVYRGRGCETDFAQLQLTETGLSQGEVVPLPDCREAEIWAALVLGVRDYVRKCGFSKIVLGLSGGIDSSLVAAIAAEAVGGENVLGVLMSSPYTSEGSVTDAIALAENLGIQTQHLHIEAAMRSFDETLADLFARTESGVAEENLQSRIRGTLLMAISNKLGHLLISTGNKSEMAVGYCTLYGDMDGGLAAIADVPKTQVYALCRWLNSRWLNHRKSGVEVIPETIISKPPSAELKPNQTDQDSLPPYDELDDILHRFVEQHQSAAEIVAAGYARETVDRVIKLVSRAEFKRRQAAPGLKITDRAFGTGWRMPIASRRGDIR